MVGIGSLSSTLSDVSKRLATLTVFVSDPTTATPGSAGENEIGIQVRLLILFTGHLTPLGPELTTASRT